MTDFKVPESADERLRELQSLVTQVAEHEQAVRILHASIAAIIASVPVEPKLKPKKRKTSV